MNYVTVEVKIDHGQIVPSEPGKLPEKGKGLLTILPSSEKGEQTETLKPLEALELLQKRLHLTESDTNAWMASIREARR